ncbi:MAG TPA: methyltransferase domain-containing protein [Solirubrobacteraceae bacterium]
MATHAYALENPLDHERLVIQAKALDRIAERYMREAGFAPGMRVLDLGSGMGDSALLAARLTAPDGRVVAVERSAETAAAARARLESLGATAVDYVQADVTDLPPLESQFDAVITRLLIMHVADPVAVLRDAAALVRPGGIILSMEYDLAWLPCHPPSPTWDRAVEILVETMRRAGIHTRMGLELRSAFVAAGLGEPTMRSEQDVGGSADWTGYDNLALVLRSLLPVIEATGSADPDELDVDTLADRFREEVADRGSMAAMPPLVGAWARVVSE